MIGQTVDNRYAIVRLLGKGGMGAVYEARHTGTGRRVAVKVILGQSLQEDQSARFHREARAIGAVESEHIAQVFDTGRDRETGAPYIAMEFLEGEDVQALLDRLGPLPVDLSLRVAFQACRGLECAHRAGIIHRDIKPANLFMARKEDGQRTVKLLDFGIAKMADPGLGDGGLTKTGAILGSPFYMSPEQAINSGVVDPRSDLWSLGISLYQCLCGRRPNEHIRSLGELIMTICSTPTRWIQEAAPWVTPEVAQAVHRALAIDPAARYPTAGEFAAALSALLPYGHAIVDGMLVPLDATTRAYVAPRVASLALSGPAQALTLGGTTGARAASGGPRVGMLAGGVLVASAISAGAVHWAIAGGGRPEAASEPSPSASATVPAPPDPYSTAPALPASVAVAASPLASSPALQASTQPIAATSSAPVVSGPLTPGPAPRPPKPPSLPRSPRNEEDETSRK